MRKSSVSSVVDVVGLSVAQDGVQDVDSASGQGDEALVMPFAFCAFAVVEGSAGGVALQSAERGLVEDAFEGSVAAGSALLVGDFAGLLEDGCEACRAGELVTGREAVDAAGDGEELGGEGGPHAGQAAHEGRVRVPVESFGQLGVQFGQAAAGGQGFVSQFFDDAGGDVLAGDLYSLAGCGGQGLVNQGLDAVFGRPPARVRYSAIRRRPALRSSAGST